MDRSSAGVAGGARRGPSAAGSLCTWGAESSPPGGALEDVVDDVVGSVCVIAATSRPRGDRAVGVAVSMPTSDAEEARRGGPRQRGGPARRCGAGGQRLTVRGASRSCASGGGSALRPAHTITCQRPPAGASSVGRARRAGAAAELEMRRGDDCRRDPSARRARQEGDHHRAVALPVGRTVAPSASRRRRARGSSIAGLRLVRRGGARGGGRRQRGGDHGGSRGAGGQPLSRGGTHHPRRCTRGWWWADH